MQQHRTHSVRRKTWFCKRLNSVFVPMKRLLYILICCAAIAGCKPTSTTQKTPESGGKATTTVEKSRKKKSKTEDFDKFYDRFHADSAFQMSRIKFPLGGGYHTVDNSTKWTPQNWHLMTTRVYDVDKSKYRATYSKTETSFTQKIWINQAGLFVECRFELVDGKWFLVYMNDENK